MSTATKVQKETKPQKNYTTESSTVYKSFFPTYEEMKKIEERYIAIRESNKNTSKSIAVIKVS